MNRLQKLILLAAFMPVLFCVSCFLEKVAPAAKRTIDGSLFDTNYLNEIFPAMLTNHDDQLQLKAAVKELDDELAEFHSFMLRVEKGQIKVVENFKGGLWDSNLTEGNCQFFAGYPSEFGFVSQYDKREDHNPFTLIYGLRFYPDNGKLQWSTNNRKKSGFGFTETGKLQSFYCPNFHVWIKDDGKMLYWSTRPKQ